jgi:deoxyribodipyrimidine photolyase
MQNNRLNKTNIVIVNNALRLIDNPLLVDLKGSTIFVFALTPYYFSKARYTGIDSVSGNRFKYLFNCINRFKVQLKETYNIDLLVLEGTYKQVVDKLANVNTNVNVRVLHQPYLYEVMYEDELLNSDYNKLNNNVYLVADGVTLLPFDTAVKLYETNYSKTFISFFNNYMKLQKDFSYVDTNNLNITAVDTSSIKSVEFKGDNQGFVYNFDNIVGYAENRQYISGKPTIKCEGALSLGTLSKAMAVGTVLNNKEASNEDKTAFVRSLIWADYCYVIAEVEGDKIFYRNGLSKDTNNGKIERIPDAIRGLGPEVKFYNKAMTKLRMEGYLTNRERMMLGSYIVKVLGYSHLALAELFEANLLGFQVANNWIGAQSCNGTGVDTIPGGRSFNIRKQLDQYDLDGVYK